MSECHSILTFFLFICFGTKYVHTQTIQIKFEITLLKTKYDMGKLNIKPLADRVVIEPAVAEQKTASGIIIPDTAKEKPQRGTVVAVGPGTTDNPVTVKEGDVVLYGKYAGTEFTLDGKAYLIMRESDVIAIV
jgi:chaperonin GroES